MQAAGPCATAADPVTLDLVEIGRRRGGEHMSGSWPHADVALLARLAATVDEDRCRAIADHHERAPHFAYDDALAHRYDRTKVELRRLYEDVVASGIVVEPWLGEGPPYRDSHDLVGSVRSTRTIRILLTRDAHGQGRGEGFHPMREPSGVVAGGVELLYNDLARAVHDLFGHVMLGTGFGPRGELKAAYCHMALHSEDVKAVLFTEQVAQTCWFYFGPHVRDRAGRLYGRGEREYVEPRERPYPAQKVYAAGSDDLAAFRRMFHFTEVW